MPTPSLPPTMPIPTRPLARWAVFLALVLPFAPIGAGQCLVETLHDPESKGLAGPVSADGGVAFALQTPYQVSEFFMTSRTFEYPLGSAAVGENTFSASSITAVAVDNDGASFGTVHDGLLILESDGEDNIWFEAFTPATLSVAVGRNAAGTWFAVGDPDDGAEGHVDLYRSANGVSDPSFVTTITAPSGASTGMRFGASVSLSGDTLAISAPRGDVGAVDGGQFYAFRFNGTNWGWNSWYWGGTAGEERYATVATNGQSIIAGSPLADDGGPDSGRVNIFEWNGTVFAANSFWWVGADGAQWGSALDIDGDHAIIGSANGGFASRLQWNGSIWDYEETITAPTSGGGFGVDVAVDASPHALAGGPRFYVSHTGHEPGDGSVGVVHVFTTETSPVTDLGQGLAGWIGLTPTLTSGTVCAFAGELELTAGLMRPSSIFSLVVGFSEIHLPFKGGTLVPNPDVLVNGLPTLGGSFSVAGQLPYGLAGIDLTAQAWVVDADGPSGMSATNALRMELGQ